MQNTIRIMTALFFILSLLISCNNAVTEQQELKTLTIGARTAVIPPGDVVVDLAGAQKGGTRSGNLSGLVLIKLSGRIQHFGFDLTQSPPAPFTFSRNVPDARVWIAEFPFTRDLNLRSSEEGIWTMWVIKWEGTDIEFSYIYEKEGWHTTKSGVIPVTDEDNTDIAVQFIDPFYYSMGVKPAVEQQLSAVFGFPITIQNSLTITVGKSWASMHEYILPHGDPGAVALIAPAVALPQGIGPIYFNDSIQPDPALTSTSVDGGVVWLNLPVGIYTVTAQKAGVQYKNRIFKVTEEDILNGVELYIASPPDSVEGDNDSAPGLP